MSEKTAIPPKWADRILGWYCNAQVREQVQGDAHELFYWRLDDKGPSKARKAFVWDVVRLFKWSNIRRKGRQKQQLNNIAMFKNYFKIGLRNLWKQKMPSMINIIGLSLAVGCCLVSFKWVESKFIKDSFHDRASDTYLITPSRTIDGDKYRYAQTGLMVTEMVKEQVPGIDLMTRFTDGYGRIKVQDRKFDNSFFYVDSEFLEVFSFPMISGNKTALNDPRSVVLSRARSEAFFGEQQAVGQEISVEINGEEKFFVVSGVIENAPDNSSFRPEMLLNISFLESISDKSKLSTYTFVVLNKSVNQASLASSFDKLVAQKNKLTPKATYDDIVLEPITTMANNSESLVRGLGGTTPMAPVIVLTAIGALMLLLATANYVNIATVMAMKRMKEIGVRKVIGSGRGQLISQFLTENLILCTLAIVLGCLLASAFFIPWFNGISGSTLTLDLLNHQNLWWFLLILLTFITVVSGAYPAFYISAFKPVDIFRGNKEKGGKRRITGVLLTFQMTLAVVTIVAGIMFVKTNRINRAKDWGYDQYNKLVFVKPEGKTYKTLAAELKKNPNLEDVAISSDLMGRAYGLKEVNSGDLQMNVNIISSSENYPELLGIRVREGAGFSTEALSDNNKLLLVNETFMNQFQLDFKDNPVVTLDSAQYNIIGVVDDFHSADLREDIRPTAFRVMPDSILNRIVVRVREGSVLDMKEEVANLLSELDPENKTHDVGFQDAVFDGYFEEMEGIGNIMLFTASLAMLLSAMGLFGLVSLSISARQKDFSIKKVLGANLRQLAGDIYKRFTLILGIAIVLGGTASVFLIGMLLDSAYGSHESIGVLPIALAGVILLAIAALTINSQIINVKRMNPAENLRAE